jgi:hypothetical protein
MDNQHRKSSGYRELSAEEIALMNEIKAKGEELAALCDKLDKHLFEQTQAAYALGDNELIEKEMQRINAALPSFWLGIGKADLQVGIMKLVRSVAQPTTF